MIKTINKYIFLSYPFDVVDDDMFFYMVDHFYFYLTLTKYYMHY
jgi:hypothetical protein